MIKVLVLDIRQKRFCPPNSLRLLRPCLNYETWLTGELLSKTRLLKSKTMSIFFSFSILSKKNQKAANPLLPSFVRKGLELLRNIGAIPKQKCLLPIFFKQFKCRHSLVLCSLKNIKLYFQLPNI